MYQCDTKCKAKPERRQERQRFQHWSGGSAKQQAMRLTEWKAFPTVEGCALFADDSNF